jgi:hypothetical protein
VKNQKKIGKTNKFQIYLKVGGSQK